MPPPLSGLSWKTNRQRTKKLNMGCYSIRLRKQSYQFVESWPFQLDIIWRHCWIYFYIFRSSPRICQTFQSLQLNWLVQSATQKMIIREEISRASMPSLSIWARSTTSSWILPMNHWELSYNNSVWTKTKTDSQDLKFNKPVQY